MIGGSVIGAVAAYLFQMIVGRSLGDAASAPVVTLWTALFIIATVILIPLEQYATREASRDRHVFVDDIRVWIPLVGVAAVAGVGFVLGTDERFFAGEPTYVFQMGLMMAGYGVLFLGRGILAGQRRFKAVGVVLAAESSLRFVVAAVILALGGGAVAVGWSMVVAPVAIVLAAFWRRPETTSPALADRPARFLGAYASGSAASQILLAASPLAVSFLGGSAGLYAIVSYTFTMFRAPLTIIYSLQGRLLSMLVRLVDAGERRRVRSLAALIAGSGVVLTLLALLVGRAVGPALMRALFGDAIDPAAEVAGWIAAGMVAASTAQVTGQILVAEGRTGVLARAWVVGLIVAVALLVTIQGAADLVVASAFGVGEAAALCMVGFTVLRSHRDRSTSSRPSGDSAADVSTR
jgi:O-antigen/teichoic acid export membrane protein